MTKFKVKIIAIVVEFTFISIRISLFNRLWFITEYISNNDYLTDNTQNNSNIYTYICICVNSV